MVANERIEKAASVFLEKLKCSICEDQLDRDILDCIQSGLGRGTDDSNLPPLSDLQMLRYLKHICEGGKMSE